MSGHTPTTLQVEVAFLVAAGHSTHAGSRKEAFDRWLDAHDAEVLREAADALIGDESNLNPAHPVELAYINCTRIDAQELRHRADRIERGER